MPQAALSTTSPRFRSASAIAVTMPALTNPKHERFAQELAKGKTQTEAYAEAGYKPDDGNATRLTGNDRIAARVAEIQERAAVRTEITIASITERLLKIAAKGEGKEDAPMLSVARASLMDAAKLNGLVVDKSIAATTTLEDMLDSLEGATGQPAAATH